jgi:hypothetical protein
MEENKDDKVVAVVVVTGVILGNVTVWQTGHVGGGGVKRVVVSKYLFKF